MLWWDSSCPILSSVFILLAVHSLCPYFIFLVVVCGIFWYPVVSASGVLNFRPVLLAADLQSDWTFWSLPVWGPLKLPKATHWAGWTVPVRMACAAACHGVGGKSLLRFQNSLSLKNFVSFKYFYECFFSILEYRVNLSQSQWLGVLQCLNLLSNSGPCMFGELTFHAGSGA